MNNPFDKMNINLEMMNKTDKEIYKKIQRSKKNINNNNEMYFYSNSSSLNKSLKNSNFNIKNINSNEPDDLENLLKMENDNSFIIGEMEGI